MKKAWITSILIIISTIGYSQTNPSSEAKFKLTGKLINEIVFPPHCGYEAWGLIIEFKIIEYSNSKYTSDTIGVIFTCPEFYEDDFFETGKTYTLNLSNVNKSNFSWNIFNDSLLSKYDKKLWVTDAKKLN
jgi:hypothetical protein